MVTDRQVKKLRNLMERGMKLSLASLKTGMDEKTARKYLRSGKLPSELTPDRTWRTRPDPFEEVWPWAAEFLEVAPGLEAKTLFEALQREHPGRFSDGQLRTFQRKVKNWRATEGPAREVYFPQIHHPGVLSASDFTHMSSLGITIAGQPFEHLLYHFVLTYSNWETGTICFSESFESLSQGLQDALWEAGGTPRSHRTDRLSSAVHRVPDKNEFTDRYQDLLCHYGLEGERTNPQSAHENGDIEKSHDGLKRAIEQALLLRGSRDFEDRTEYEGFLRSIFSARNAGRCKRFEEERAVLCPLPAHRLEARKNLTVRVGPGSTIRVLENVYSVHSRLIGEQVVVKVGPEDLEIWYGQRRVDGFPRLRGRKKHRIDYRHMMDWLVRKPGAFENYLYRDALFPTSRFRMAYDHLVERSPATASRSYLQILELAAKVNEDAVDEALRQLIDGGGEIEKATVESKLGRNSGGSVTDVKVDAVDLALYDQLLASVEETV